MTDDFARLSRLHEVATERTVQLAAVIEKAFAILDQNTVTGGGAWVMARDAHAVLAPVDTDAVLREVRAKAWDEGALWAAVECAAIVDESEPWLAPGDNPYREGS